MNEETIARLAVAIQRLENAPEPDELTNQSDDDLAIYALNTRFGGNLAFSRARGWHTFPAKSHSWRGDSDGEEVATVVQTMLRDLRRDEKDSSRIRTLGSKALRDNVVEMLKGLPEVRYSGEWNNHPSLIAAPNGVINLRTGELWSGRPDQRLSKSVAVEYDSEAACPRWERFLAEVFAHDPELPRYLQRLLGYGITGHNSEQCFAVLYGEGSNGKSTLLTVLRELLGGHAATVPFDMFTTSNRRGGPDTEMLVGARLALASETNRSAVLDSAAIKNATGGEEIVVNPKYRKPYAFKPQALILLASNYKPVVREQDLGTWRRVKLIPFLQRFEGDAKDMDLGNALRDEYPGILAWLVRGAVEWHCEGLADPESVIEAVRAYKEDSDPLAGFYPGVLEPDPNGRVSNADIWAAYTAWAEGEGMDAFRQSATLTKALRERDRSLATYRTKSGRGVSGVRLSGGNGSGPGIFNSR